MWNALSIDVEEWFQVYNLSGILSRDDWNTLPSRVEASTHTFLDLLDTHGARATFFLLGWIAERHPDLVAEIAARGHEVASHGYGHELLSHMDPESFHEDLSRTEDILEGITGRKPSGYRAPSFSVGTGTLWALDVLLQRGYRYDSSIFPVSGRRYGHPAAPGRLHVARSRGTDRILWSFPLLTRRLLGVNLPLAGGGYLRFFPISWIRSGIHAMNQKGWPAMIYLHPWELDPDHPVPGGLPFHRRFLHTVNLHRTGEKLASLLRTFRFTTASEALDSLVAERPELEEEAPPAALFPGGDQSTR